MKGEINLANIKQKIITKQYMYALEKERNIVINDEVSCFCLEFFITKSKTNKIIHL